MRNQRLLESAPRLSLSPRVVVPGSVRVRGYVPPSLQRGLLRGLLRSFLR